jgi:hypothetical protein
MVENCTTIVTYRPDGISQERMLEMLIREGILPEEARGGRVYIAALYGGGNPYFSCNCEVVKND